MRKGILIIMTLLTIMNVSKAEPTRGTASVEIQAEQEIWTLSVTD